MTTKDFIEAFKAAVETRREGGPYTPTGVVEQWEQIVSMIEAGYDDSIYEYDNDLSVRNLLAELLEDPLIQAHAESAWVTETVDALDKRLRAVMTDQPIRDVQGPWWRSHLPIIASAEFADDLQNLYGYKVPRVV
jgi:hypothetical protein